jgi:hypothetical protein
MRAGMSAAIAATVALYSLLHDVPLVFLLWSFICNIPYCPPFFVSPAGMLTIMSVAPIISVLHCSLDPYFLVILTMSLVPDFVCPLQAC